MANNEEERKPKPQQAPRWMTIRDRPGELASYGLGLACILLVLGIWWLLTAGAPEKRIISPSKVPSIAETVSGAHSLWFERAFARSAMMSLSRVLGGFLLAAAIAVPLGVLSSCYPRFNAFLKPLTIFGRNIPIAALTLLTLMWFKTGELQKVMFIFIAAVAFIIFDTARSVDAISNRYLDTAYTLGARRDRRKGIAKALFAAAIYMLMFAVGFIWMGTVEETFTVGAAFAQPKLWIWGFGAGLLAFLLWFPIMAHQAIGKVLLPLALPQIVNSLRLLFGLAFGYIMLAEAINPKIGLGQILYVSQKRGFYDHLYLSLFAIALIAYVIDRAVLFAQRRLFPYVENG